MFVKRDASRRRNTAPGDARRRRAGFTLLELILASMVTALVGTAAASMIFAVTAANEATSDVRAVKSAGTFVTNRVASAIRSARAVGVVNPASISLWLEDADGNDAVSLNETATIRYDAVTQQIIYEQSAAPAASTLVVGTSTLTSVLNVRNAMIAAGPVKSVVWAENVSSCSFRGHPTMTDTRVVETSVAIAGEDGSKTFCISASPRASADYLFVSNARAEPTLGATRYRRARTAGYQGMSATPVSP